jgi:hypothetical protein
MNTSIVAAEKRVDIGCRVVLWDEPAGYSFLRNKKFINRTGWNFNKLEKEIKQFTVHWTATYTAKHTFNGLNARGLSCNFIIDDDNINGYATLHQTLDILHGGWSQGNGLNGIGPGVEICYMPNAWDNPNAYSEENIKKYNVQPHETIDTIVHKAKLKVFLPTEAQMNTLRALMFGFSSLFPNVPRTFPRDSQGNVLSTVLTNPVQYSGFAMHYHLSRQKIDAAGIDMVKLEKDIGDRLLVGY